MTNLLICVLLADTVFGFTLVEIPPESTDVDRRTNVKGGDDGIPVVSLIVGGDTAAKGDNPWLIVLYYNSKFICGGSILNKWTILTAAHCIVDKKQSRGKYEIKAGDYTTTRIEDSEQIISVKRVRKHKRYNKIYRFNKDIAILKLSTALTLNNDVQKIRIADAETEQTLLDNPRCFLAGIGDTSYPGGTTPRVVQEVNVTMMSRDTCSTETQKYDLTFTNHMLCSTDNRKGACSGDSGGPLTCYDNYNNPFQVGIVSWGSKDCWIGFNVYTRVSAFAKWIEKKL